ncbi:MAG: adenylyl-sulfate kinase [Alistipes sp.]|nr:adenylyl-sulfate kinase [Alistipes sp.]
MENIYPIFERVQSRTDKERQLQQRSVVLWFTGLSGSGKSTLALALEQRLSAEGFLCHILDGDNVRSGINRDLGFSDAERRENIRRIAEVCRMFVDAGIITLASFLSPSEELRTMARGIIGKDDFVEIYLSTPIEECERRDVKGLYRKARCGVITDFTGVDSPFEPPHAPQLIINTEERDVEECVDDVMQYIRPRITLK